MAVMLRLLVVNYYIYLLFHSFSYFYLTLLQLFCCRYVNDRESSRTISLYISCKLDYIRDTKVALDGIVNHYKFSIHRLQGHVYDVA